MAVHWMPRCTVAPRYTNNINENSESRLQLYLSFLTISIVSLLSCLKCENRACLLLISVFELVNWLRVICPIVRGYLQAMLIKFLTTWRVRELVSWVDTSATYFRS
jgi:hypothetical protein